MQVNKKIFFKAIFLVLTIAGLAKVIAAVSFTPNSQPVGYVGQPVASSSDVSTGTAKMYSIDYSSKDWSGNLHSYPLSSAGTVGATDDWDGGAAKQIKAQSNANSRYIITMKGSVGIPFLWNQLSTGANSQQVALDPVSVATSATVSPILNYIRGDSSNEGSNAGQYRPRASGLGDIIHSTPVYWNDGTNKTVFVGANDGMLHAINAVNGAERFAYIPSVLIPMLPALKNPSYTHQYFVDGRMDVKKFTNQTILAGALGAGGKGLYALDVTNAAATSEVDAASKILWEITNATSGFANLGDTYGAPTLFTMPDGTPALVVGNGYNNTGDGHAWLYLINAKTGALIHAFDTGSGSTGSPNGLSSPSLRDSDSDGKMDTAYAGDIDGNLWKFSLVAPYTVSSLYTNTAGAAHAITMAPALKAHTLGGVMVMFVTGRMFTSDDVTDTSYHYAYGIWDGAPALNDTLLEQTLTEVNYTAVTPTIRVRTATSYVPDWTEGAGHHKGWKTKLPLGGERVVGDGAFVTGSVFQFFSTNPTISPNTVPPGENWWMQLNVMTGGDNGSTLFDLNGDKEFTSDDQVGGHDPVGRFMGGGVRSQLIALSANGVDVYQSNYDKNSAPVAAEPTTTTTTSTTTGDRGVSGGHFDFDIYCYTNCSDTTGASSGKYYTGQNTETNTNGLYFTHVHEYDDIYDVTGVNMLAPSQSLHKLSRVKYAATTTGPTSVPDTPTLAASKSYPGSGVTVVSNTTATGKTAKNVPATTYNYVNGATSAVTGYPAVTSTSTTTTTTTKTTYTTTLTIVQAINIGVKNNQGRYPYDLNTTVRKWDTVVTTVVTSPIVNFKVLMANQANSPAVRFSLDGVEDSAYKYQASSGLAVATLPSYQLATIKSLLLEMPLTAFKSQDWGTGITRAGLHPTKADCVYNNPKLGPLGEWRNGALTVQIVDASVQDSDVQLNVSTKPEMGYRLKNSSMKSKLIAEYTLFWHHPNNLCMADSGWTKMPGEDTSVSDAIAGVKAAGSSDPVGGIFGIDATAGTSTGTPGTVTTTVTNADGSTTTTTVVTTVNASGGTTVTTTVTTVPAPISSGSSVGVVTGGVVDSGGGGCFSCGEVLKTPQLGRITWRELQQ